MLLELGGATLGQMKEWKKRRRTEKNRAAKVRVIE